jgi:hypothetical protein
VKEDPKPLKQLSQNVPNSMFVCPATAITRSRVARANRDSLRKGEYIRLKPSINVIALLKNAELVALSVVVSLLLANIPMKSTATASKMITPTENIYYNDIKLPI